MPRSSTGVTQVNIIEAIGRILARRPRSEFRPEHKITKLYGARADIVAPFRDEFRIPHLLGGFGMTEIPGVCCNPFEGPNKQGTMGPVGRHPDPDAQMGRVQGRRRRTATRSAPA